jgi:hypothetical protein
MSLQIRRGTAAQLANITPVIGELIYTTDTQEVYVGDGSTSGGIPIAVGGSGNVSGTNLLTGGQVSATGNVTGGNIRTGGQVSATGNITGNYFLGNGSQLTGINTSAANASTLTGSTLSSNVTTSSLTTVGTLGSLSVSGNVTGGNIATGGIVSATGNITGGNISATNHTGLTVSVTGNVTGGNIATGGVLSVTGAATANGTITGGNIATVGYVSATGNVTGSYIFGNGSQLTGLPATYANSNVAAYLPTYTGNIAAGNISVTGINSATGNVTGGNILTGGLISATANVAGGNLNTGGIVSATGNIRSAAYIFAQQSIDAGANVSATGYTGGNISVTGNITGSYLLGNGALLSGISGGTPTLIANGNSNVKVATADSNVTVSVNSVSPLTTFANTGAYVAGIVSASGNVIGGNLTTGGKISTSGSIIGADVTGSTLTGSLTTNAQSNITSVGTLTSLSVSGNITGGNISATAYTGTTVSMSGNITGGNLSVSTGTITVGNIVNGAANGVGNIGSSTTYFNTVFAKATSAQYADLAENYLADTNYAPGTVVSFGGVQEITQSTQDHDPAVVGVISAYPAYQMNTGLVGTHVATVALIGRVPCQVQGIVWPGSLMVSAGNGRARAELNPAPGTIIGKAVQAFNGDVGTIEILVGRV